MFNIILFAYVLLFATLGGNICLCSILHYFVAIDQLKLDELFSQLRMEESFEVRFCDWMCFPCLSFFFFFSVATIRLTALHAAQMFLLVICF